MSKYVTITFPSEEKAYEGVRALRDLHAQGDLSLYGAAVLAKDANGQLSLRDEQDEGPVGWALGTLTGGLIGAFAGPAGMAAGMAGGAIAGSFGDIYNAGVGAEYVNDVGGRLQEAQAAVVAEVDENWVLPLDTRMDALGGQVLRQHRIDVEDAQFDREIALMSSEIDELDREIAAASGEAKAKLQARRSELHTKLSKTTERVKARSEAFASETEAKITTLKTQMSNANADFKDAIQERSRSIAADREAFSARLKQSWQNAKNKLG